MCKNTIAVLLQIKLLKLALSCSLSLLLTLYAGLLVMLSLAKLGHDTGLNALSLETTKCIIKSLIFFYSNFCHLISLPSLCKEIKSQIFYSIIIRYFFQFVNRILEKNLKNINKSTLFAFLQLKVCCLIA